MHARGRNWSALNDTCLHRGARSRHAVVKTPINPEILSHEHLSGFDACLRCEHQCLPMSCTAVLHWDLFPPPRAFGPRLRGTVKFWQIAAQSSCVLLRDMQSAVLDSYERGEELSRQLMWQSTSRGRQRIDECKTCAMVLEAGTAGRYSVSERRSDALCLKLCTLV